MIILGIETSCDETAASVVKAGKNVKILSNIVSSQVKLHAKWGGVVPNLAAREHLKNILPVIEISLEEASVKIKDIDLIAVTNGPGLIPALLIGTNTAKALAYAWEKPLIGVHHIEGHIYANFIGDKISASSKFKVQSSRFPILCLVVSGGHTQLVLMKDHLKYKIIGQTLDDAAGEAFDKVARILGLGYPGGPAIAEAAMKSKIKSEKLKVQGSAFFLPRPMINSKNLDFSFSGLKTAVLYTVKKNPEILRNKKMLIDLCSEFQQAVIDVLIHKTLAAAEKYNPKMIMLAGGVSANEELRDQLSASLKKHFPNTKYRIPETRYSLDNAAMIASAGFFRWQKMNKTERESTSSNWKILETDANLKLKQ
ncbi:MAG: tRNA (adenosine(37)-N6)-threonylcarbamoyltransferase complex transferase subunit TsaD [Parcubacteria group bacterium]|jgi:N6-L-threonylcarbamoyladenine synthase